MYLSNDILVNCIQKGLRSNWLSDSAKNIAKNQKEFTIRKRNWINSFNSSLSIPIPIPIPFIQFLCDSNSWNWNWYQFQFQFRNWPQPWAPDIGRYKHVLPLYIVIDLARNGNSGCANEIFGCAKCHFWRKSPWKWKNWGNFRVCN